MTKTRKILAAALTSALLIVPAVAVVDAGTPGNPTSQRFSGANRYGTSGAVAVQRCAAVAAPMNIIIASGENFPDALSASGLAGQLGRAAIMLTQSGALPAETISNLSQVRNACGINSITIIGGTSAVSTAVQTQLAAYGNVTRIAGANRYETATLVATQVRNAGNTVILATGANYPDALTAGVMAAAGPHALVLNDGPTLRPEVAAYLRAAAVTSVIIVGGPTAVPLTVEQQLTSTGIAVTRLGGLNRYETATLVANRLLSPGGGFAFNGANSLLASGLNFPDALSASPLGAQLRGPILLTTNVTIPDATATWLRANSATMAQITVVGGPTPIPDYVVAEAVFDATNTSAALLTSAGLSNTSTPRNIGVSTTTGSAAVLNLTAVNAGPAANSVVVNFVDNGNDGTPPAGQVTVQQLVGAPVPTFNVLGSFNDPGLLGWSAIEAQDVVDAWNANVAARNLFIATAVTPAATFNIVPPTTNTAGATLVNVIATFSRAILNPTTFGPNQFQVWSAPSTFNGVMQLDAVNALAPVLSPDGRTLTVSWSFTSATAQVPNFVFGPAGEQLRIAANVIRPAPATSPRR